MIATARKRWKPILLSLVLVPLGFLSLPFVFVVSNAGSAIISLVINREPTRAELIGTYNYQAPWGAATLALRDGGTYQEMVITNTGSAKHFEGVWTVGSDVNSAEVKLTDFGMVWDDDHDREIDLCIMSFYKRRIGHTYAVVNEDLGEQFEQQ